MAPTHDEVAHEVGDGWTAVWDATDIPPEVREAFDAARTERQDDGAKAGAAGEQTAT
jgi:hypothetical protein